MGRREDSGEKVMNSVLDMLSFRFLLDSSLRCQKGSWRRDEVSREVRQDRQI